LAIQFVIQQYIIDPDKIHAQIQAKKNEPAKENKFMTKMMEMQKQQQERAKQPGKKN
jgi:YidC/Oxa1 family membrane protein insertase